jgi:Zn-dependent M28 family amino/carboxypeptidase
MLDPMTVRGIRLAALWLVLALAAGCGQAGPTDRPGPPDAAGSLGPTAISARITRAGLGGHLNALARMASEHGGNRGTGSPGNAATVDYIREVLAAAGYAVVEEAFETPVYLDPGGNEITTLGQGGRSFADGLDFRALLFSAAGTAEGPVVALDWDEDAAGATGLGCSAADFAGIPKGAIVLVRPANCFRRAVVLNAQAAGAGALVTAVPWSGPGEVRRSTLIDPDGLTIPAFAATRDVGVALASAAASGARVRVTAAGTTEDREVRSLIAELPGTDAERVVMIGAHLDSSMDGPGMNDNGSGVAALLELSAALVGTRPNATIRVAFWAAEETGLQGSGRYVSILAHAERERIVAYLNADMLGSPNGIRGVYDGAGAAPGSTAIRDLFAEDLDAAGLAWEGVDLGMGSDHGPFAEAGIPTGGLFSGTLEPLTPEQAERYGRAVGSVPDACYHLACDGRSNVDEALHLELAQSLGRVLVFLASAPAE